MRNLSTVSERWLRRVPALLLAAAGATVAIAHHSFDGIYDSAQTVRLTGTVREFLFIHPHPFLVVEVRDGAQRQGWRAEMDNRSELADIGMTRDTLRPGDEVIISGSPGRSQPHILYLLHLERPADRLRYRQIGSMPILDAVPADAERQR